MKPSQQRFAACLADNLDAFLLVNTSETLREFIENEDCTGFKITCHNDSVRIDIMGNNIHRFEVDELTDEYLQYLDPKGTFEGMDINADA